MVVLRCAVVALCRWVLLIPSYQTVLHLYVVCTARQHECPALRALRTLWMWMWM